MWKFFRAIFSLEDRPHDQSKWTTEQWREYLLSQAMSQSERDDILAMFANA